jgi:hypothetical protein
MVRRSSQADMASNVTTATTKQTTHWSDSEIDVSAFEDIRLGRRFGEIVKQLGNAMGETIPLACQDWANTKAAYRFFSNSRVQESDILHGHFAATRQRFDAATGPILLLQDTTEFSYHREHPERIGFTTCANSGKDKAGRWRKYAVCGVLMHASLAVTLDALPLGLAAVKFWTRKTFKGTNELKRHINPTRVPIEKKESIRWLENLRQSMALLAQPDRCIHVGDRESDIYELFCLAHEIGSHFLIRTCVDRLAADGKHTIATEMADTPVKGLHRIDVRDDKGRISRATLELKYRRVCVLPPIGKQKNYPPLHLTVIHAIERGAPKGRKPIDWKLITDLPVQNRQGAIEKLNWYAMRWKIEVFHKILKSGCKAEESRLRTAERLANLIALFCILSWRIFWLTMMARSAPKIAVSSVFTKTEIALLDAQATGPPKASCERTLADYLIKLAKLGGYLARTHDPPPGNMVIWRGWRRLNDMLIGAQTKFVGN